MIHVSLPDGSKKEIARGASILELAQAIGPRLARDAVAALVNGELRDVRDRLNEDATLTLVTQRTEQGLEVLRHTTTHVMAQAVKRLFPDAKLGIGPAIEDGFYYDFDVAKAFTSEDLERIEREMRKIIEADLAIERLELTRDAAREILERADEPLKMELLDEIEEGTVTLYRQGDFADLCRGPHLQATGRINAEAFKLLSVAGAYWRGDESRPMLQRIYGTAWEKKDDLDQHLWRLEEAARRDHRKLGKDLDLYSIHEEGGAGLVCWHPKGARIRHEIEQFWYHEHERRGYEIVSTPHIGKGDLWAVSGHLDFYRENMYSPMDIDGVDYYVKPMNCPYQILIYKTRIRSYRELPLRWGELGTVYRYERSGVLHGLLRVRGFTIDDAHIICRPDQVEEEIRKVYDFCLAMLEAFGFRSFDIYLSTRPQEGKAVGEPARWEQATDSLRRALDARGLPYQVDEGGGAFYGPKIDIKVKDALNRSWQCSTIQFDFNLPERFDMTYIAEDGQASRPYVVHRALLGSLERFMGALIEHYAGAFPVWLAPVQAVVLPVTDAVSDYAATVREALRDAGIRVETWSERSRTLSYQVRQAQLEKIPYMLVVGEREAEAGTVSLRLRTEENLGPKPLAEVIDLIKTKVAEKALL
jgi:threonyl-tRNA synthetase